VLTLDVAESSLSPSAVLVSGKETPARVSPSGRWVAVSVIMTSSSKKSSEVSSSNIFSVVDSSSTSLPILTGCSVFISVVVKSSSEAMEVVVTGEGASLTASKVVSSSCL